MRLAQLGLACVGIFVLSGIAAAQQAVHMIDPRPAPLSRVDIYELRQRVLESSPDAIAASAIKVAKDIADSPNPKVLASPYRQENNQWRFWLTVYNSRGWEVYRTSEWLPLIPHYRW
jgi:hypothetical protein